MTVDTQTSASDIKSRNALRAATILTILHLIFTAALAIIGFRNDEFAMQATSAITFLIAIAGFVSIVQSRRGRAAAGIWILIFAICISVPFISFFVADYGWLIVFSIPLVIGLTAGFAFPLERFPRALILGALAGIAGLLLDLYGNPNRPQMPNSEIVLPIVVAAIIALGLAILIRQFPHFALRIRLLTLFLAVAIIPLSTLIYLNNILSRNAITESTNISLSLVAAQTGEQIDDFIETNLDQIQADAQITILQSALELAPDDLGVLESGVVNTLQLLTQKNPNYIRSYSLLNREGQYIASYPQISGEVPPFLGLNPSLVNSLQILLLSDVPYVSPVFVSADFQTKTIYFAARTNTVSGDPLGLLIVNYRAEILQDMMTNRNGSAGQDSFGILFDENHVQLAHGINPDDRFKAVIPLGSDQIANLKTNQRLPDLPDEDLTINAPKLEEHLDNVRTQNVFTLEAGEGILHDSQVAVFQLQSKPWTVAFFQPRETFLAPVGEQTRLNLLLGIAFIGIVTFSAIRAAQVISRPITHLTEQVERISAGDLDTEIQVSTQDEIGRLASTFNRMTSQIRNLLSGLESQVTDRTLELERQALQIQTAAEVARDASTVQELDTLLDHTVELIHNRFGFYHVGIFLLDEVGEFAVLQAANSQGGREMLAQGHKLKVGEIGIVGDTTSTGRPHIALDVGLDSTHFAHPLLPDTRSEIALPLKVGETIMGALDVQSKEPGAFDDEDITVLQVLADQLAVAIRNSQLLADLQQTVHELQTAHGEYTQRSWQEWGQRSLRGSGYRYRGTNIETAAEIPAEVETAWNNKDTITKSSEGQSVVAVPIQLRDTTLGVIKLQLEEEQIPTEITSLTHEIAERLALALDNARLLEATQHRAFQEQLIGEITSRMRETLDVNTVLRTTIREMREALDLHDVSVQLEVLGEDAEADPLII